MIRVVNKRTHSSTYCDWYIGRPGPLGNPYSHLSRSDGCTLVSTREEAVERYAQWLKTMIRIDNAPVVHELYLIQQRINLEQALNLVCWCTPKVCHGDVILQYLDIRELTVITACGDLYAP